MELNRPLRTIKVYNNESLAGFLQELPEGKYSFSYDKDYLDNKTLPSISITLPKAQKGFVSDISFLSLKTCFQREEISG